MRTARDTTPKKLTPEQAREAKRLLANIIDAIQRAMTEDCCSCSELAKALGVDKSHVSRWFTKYGGMSTRTVAKIMLALGRRVTIKVEKIATPQ